MRLCGNDVISVSLQTIHHYRDILFILRVANSAGYYEEMDPRVIVNRRFTDR